MKKLERLSLKYNSGEVSSKKNDEKNADACDCWRPCDLPDFIKDDPNRTPTCFIGNDWDCDGNTSCNGDLGDYCDFHTDVGGFCELCPEIGESCDITEPNFKSYTACCDDCSVVSCDYNAWSAIHTAQESNECDEYSHQNSQTSICEANVCVCENGKPVNDRICRTHGANICYFCNDGYHLEGNVCVNNTCYCANGQPINSCKSHNNHDCATCNDGFKPQIFNNFTTCAIDQKLNEVIEVQKCDAGYHLDQNSCVINVCLCENGEPISDTNCSNHEGNECQSCLDGYHLEDMVCAINSCYCDYGVSVSNGKDCIIDGSHHCSECDEYYHINAQTSICEGNVCICENGEPVNNRICKSHAANECDACIEGYHLEEGLCAINNCYCANGIPNFNCIFDKGHDCTSCNPGFTIQVFNGFRTCIELTCPENIENCLICSKYSNRVCEVCENYYSPTLSGNSCQKNVCTCNGGTVVSNCEVDGTEHCVSCDNGNVLIKEDNTCSLPDDSSSTIDKLKGWLKDYQKKIKKVMKKVRGSGE